MPVRIKKRKVKKGGNIPLSATHDFIPIFFHFLHFKILPLHDIQVPAVFLH